MIRIVTAYDNGAADEFARLRKKRWFSRDFVVAGEWSESPFHQGKEKFAVGATADRKFWALLNVSFPTRIVAVAEVDQDVSVEEIAAEMMRAVEEKGGPYIEGVHDWGEIDAEAFLEFYNAARKRDMRRRNRDEERPPDATSEPGSPDGEPRRQEKT